LAPWQEVAVDLIGPWSIEVNGNTLTFNALTMIDTVSNWVELVRIHNKTSVHIALQFENQWLSRYPRPIRCIFDQGPEFKGPFQQMLYFTGIKAAPTTVKNPQANAICERMHQVVGNALRVLLYTQPPQDDQQATMIVDTALQTAAYSIRAAVHGTMRISPGALVYGRDMLLDIPLIVDLELLRQRRQAMINKNLINANRKRIAHDYTVGEEVWITVPDPKTLQERVRGPYRIVQTHTNGTVTILIRQHITERINIRRIRPVH